MAAKRESLAAVLLAAVLLVSGCEQTGLGQNGWTPQEADAVSVAADGRVTETVQETLDQSYYDETELEDLITSEVEAYNQKNGEDAVTVKSFETEDGSVTLKIQYQTARDYREFNHVDFYFGSIINAQLEGYLFDTNFYKIQDGKISGKEVDNSAILQDMSAQLLIVQAPLEVHVEGTVTYVSTNAEILSGDTVNATGKSLEDSALELPSSEIYSEEEITYSAQKSANRVYIIYETE